jgi:hypothetical protein
MRTEPHGLALGLNPKPAVTVLGCLQVLPTAAPEVVFRYQHGLRTGRYRSNSPASALPPRADHALHSTGLAVEKDVVEPGW